MIDELEIVLLDNKFKRNQMKKLKFSKIKIFATDLSFITSLGCGIYKAMTLFNSRYKNEHQILVLEGVDHRNKHVYAITELVANTSGCEVSGEESGYYLFLSPNLEQFFIYRKLKNPIIKQIIEVTLFGDQLFNLVAQEKDEYKLIGNNCQDYISRITNSIIKINNEYLKELNYREKENDSNNSRKHNKSKSLQVQKRKSISFNKLSIHNLAEISRPYRINSIQQKRNSLVINNNQRHLILPILDQPPAFKKENYLASDCLSITSARPRILPDSLRYPNRTNNSQILETDNSKFNFSNTLTNFKINLKSKKNFPNNLNTIKEDHLEANF